MGIAFFDFDRTLIAANSAALWIRRELRAGRLSPWTALRAGTWIFRYHLGFASIDEAIRQAIGTLAGQPESEVRGWTWAFYDEHVRGLYRPGAREAVEQHRAKGDKLVLLTSSSVYLAERVLDELRLDAALCNRFEIDQGGLHTGRTIGDLCFGIGKVGHAREYADRAGMPLSDCAFYTDSFTDLPVMEVVGRPVAVNPDGRLKRAALKRGWPVVDWGTPESVTSRPATK